ncbi:MAG: hypothetical protein HC905_04420 [Bacteroidales bacterium]|nr:hypothetical protein [Bacteroidales bacterium]
MLLVTKKSKAYLRLYDTICKNNLPDDEVIKICRNLFRENDFSSHVSYLYEVLMKSLTTFHQRLGTDEKLLSGIQEVKILFRKGLSHEGFILLDTLRKWQFNMISLPIV